MSQYIISITATDHSGIVARVSRAVGTLGGNILSASQTVHQGYFAMILSVDFEQDLEIERISQAIENEAIEPLHVYVTPFESQSLLDSEEETETFIVTTIGSDQPGILQAVSSYLASKNINIDDLYCCVKEGDFVVICEVSVVKGRGVFDLQVDLEAKGKAMGFTAHVLHENIFVATNELKLKRLKSGI